MGFDLAAGLLEATCDPRVDLDGVPAAELRFDFLDAGEDMAMVI